VAFHFREALPPGTPGFITRLSDRGYLAVDLFFILSGYVIALNYGRWFAGEAWSARRHTAGRRAVLAPPRLR
jgi:peptidoglycan/LPS O-acetylase OafA/YrhL